MIQHPACSKIAVLRYITKITVISEENFRYSRLDCEGVTGALKSRD